MKLRNKKTGEIDDFLFEVITDRIDLYRRVGSSDTKNIWSYNSLAGLNAEWEDCEPLLLDDLNKRIIRLWAHNNKLKTVISYGHDAWIGLRGEDSQGNIWKIELSSMFISELENGKSYSIDDLCGTDEL